MTEKAETTRVSELRAKAEAGREPLTPAEKLVVFGDGNANVMRYAKQGASIVSREFKPGEKPGPEWKETPAEFGLETHPARAPDGEMPANFFAQAPTDSAPPVGVAKAK